MHDDHLRQADPLPVKVWDPLIRIFHWSLAASVFVAYIFTEEGDLAHEVAGYIALGLVGFRIAWGLIGTPYARFSQFVPRPAVLADYLRDLIRRSEARHLGHNPAGAVMVLALIITVAAAGVTGWMLTTDAFWGDERVESLHEAISHLLMVLVCFHVAGVIYTGIRHRENLVRSMVTGRKSP